MHDHADAHCLMKILKGTLQETRYDFPRNAITAPEVIKKTVFKEGQVTYMSDDLGLHKISNPSETEVAVSLHREFSFAFSTMIQSPDKGKSLQWHPSWCLLMIYHGKIKR